jgi:hypothetical protein
MTGHSTKEGKSAQSPLMKFSHIAKGKHIHQNICITKGFKIIFVMINETSPSGSLLVTKVSVDLHRFNHIDYIGSTTGWTGVKSVSFSSQTKRFSQTVQIGSEPSPHPTGVTGFIAGMKRPERKVDNSTPSSVGFENT